MPTDAAYWTLPRKQLAAELAVGMTRRLKYLLRDERYGGAGYFWHLCASDFEGACYTLWELDAAYGINGRQIGNVNFRDRETTKRFWYRDTPPNYFKFMDEDAVRTIVSGEPSPYWPNMFWILWAYIGITTDYGPQERTLCPERIPFAPPPEYAREIAALEENEYLEKCADRADGGRQKYIWTDRISEVMQRSYLWWPDGSPLHSRPTASLSVELSEYVGSLPKPVSDAMAEVAQANSASDFMRIVCSADGPLGTDWTKLVAMRERDVWYQTQAEFDQVLHDKLSRIGPRRRPS